MPIKTYTFNDVDEFFGHARVHRSEEFGFSSFVSHFVAIVDEDGNITVRDGADEIAYNDRDGAQFAKVVAEQIDCFEAEVRNVAHGEKADDEQALRDLADDAEQFVRDVGRAWVSAVRSAREAESDGTEKA